MTESNNDPNRQSKPLRLFIALPLPEPILHELSTLADNLRKAIQFTGSRPRWAARETLHLTLAFLGDHPPRDAAAFKEAIREVAAGFPPQRLELRQLGVFPHWHRPRVLWAGVRDRSHCLAGLHEALHRRLAPLGYEPEAQAFRPHITLARFKDFKALEPIEKLVHNHAAFCYGPFFADRLVLFQSRQSPASVEHHEIASHLLTGNAPLTVSDMPSREM